MSFLSIEARWPYCSFRSLLSFLLFYLPGIAHRYYVLFTDINQKNSIIFLSLLFSTINQIFTHLNPNPSKKVLYSKSPSPNPKPTTGTLMQISQIFLHQYTFREGKFYKNVTMQNQHKKREGKEKIPVIQNP